jgi:hypothetical protein
MRKNRIHNNQEDRGIIRRGMMPGRRNMSLLCRQRGSESIGVTLKFPINADFRTFALRWGHAARLAPGAYVLQKTRIVCVCF